MNAHIPAPGNLALRKAGPLAIKRQPVCSMGRSPGHGRRKWANAGAA